MKIAAVESHLLSFRLSEPASAPGEPKSAHNTVTQNTDKRDTLLVRVSTDQGWTGYAPASGGEAAKKILDHVIAPFLKGRALTDPDALRILFQQGPGAEAGVSRIYDAAEIALYDLAGKGRNLPVSELIGGRVRDRIRLFASAGRLAGDSLPDAERLIAEAVRIRAMGIGAFEVPMGRGAEQDIETIAAIRREVGPDYELLAGPHSWRAPSDRMYSSGEIERIAQGLVEYRVLWMDEPFPREDRSSYLHLKKLDLIRLAAGANEPSELALLDLIESGAVDYIEMDLVRQGGYSTARRLFPDIARAGLRFTFRVSGTALDVIAAAQLGSCWPENVVRWLEYPCASMPGGAFPPGSEILKQPPAIERGELVVSRGSGLGVEVDESVIWRYPWILQ